MLRGNESQHRAKSESRDHVGQADTREVHKIELGCSSVEE